MVIPDRIRLRGLLRESPAFAGLSYLCLGQSRESRSTTAGRLVASAELVANRMVERKLARPQSGDR
jgi:hypothetical protein